jgi:hypothetical protein
MFSRFVVDRINMAVWVICFVWDFYKPIVPKGKSFDNIWSTSLTVRNKLYLLLSPYFERVGAIVDMADLKFRR